MTDALKKAAEEASAVTGLSVELHPLCSSGPPALGDENITYHVELYAPMDSDEQAPVQSRTCFGSAAALAYLEGLEAGARIATVRYERVVTAARGLIDNQDPSGVACFDDMGWLETALAELEA